MLKLLGHQKQTFILLIPKGERRRCFSNPTTSLSSTTTPFSDTQKQLRSDLDPFEILCSDEFFQPPFSDTLKKKLGESVTLTQNIFKRSDFCF